MTDKKIVEEWNIVFALAEKGCGYSASYEAQIWDPRLCGGELDNVQWVLTIPCPEGCTSSPPPGLPTNPPPCWPDYNGSPPATMVGCCEGIVQVECTGTCCNCGGVACEPSETCCDDVCVDLQTDHDHCGGCPIACEPSESCCAGNCTDTQTSNETCGSCDFPCPVAYTCCDGVCKELFGDDRLNCGDCGKTCQVGEICKNGVCKDACAANDCSFTWGDIDPCSLAETDCGVRNWKFTYGIYQFGNFFSGSSWVATTDACSQPDGVDYICITTSTPPNTAQNDCSAIFEPFTMWTCQPGETPGVDCQNSGPHEITGTGECFDVPCVCASNNVPFHALSTDEDENGTVSALAGAWNVTATCPNTCNCPSAAPVENGTDGQVVSYECVNCFPPCVGGQKCCSGQCKNWLTDPLNCGDCNINCGPGVDGNKCCNGYCVNTHTSNANCGGCGNVCATGESCCYDPSIPNSDGVCKNLNTNNYNCGSCGHECQTGIGETCCNGNCCPAENTCCFGTNCVNRNTDNNNCGNCGTVCSPGFSCINGVCVACNPPCLEAGTACCNNSCIDILSDEANCGGCNIPCAGKCCNGSCILDLNTMYNCGDCGIECPQMINQINLWQCCNGECKNLKTDPENCGFCGNVCQEPPGDTFTVPKCFLGNCAEPECECQGYEQGMPPFPGPDDVAFVASCVGNTVNCDGSCYFNAVEGGWSLYEAPGLEQPFASCGQEPDYTYCVDDKYACVDDKYVCVGDIYYCVKPIEGQDMPTYCIPKASFDAETQALIGSYIGAENCAAGCSGDGSECDPACGNGLTCCSSTCVDTQTDNAHCGGCDAAPCAAGETCKDGVCTGCTPPCASGESCCEGGTTCCETCCEDTCCPTGQSCVEGVCATCEPPCTAGQTCCGGSCCEAGIICCDQTCCAAGEFCENGSCATCNPVCYPDETCCEATCIRWKCGECPNACASAEIVCCGLPGQEVCCPEGQTCVENACYGCTPPCSESQDCCDEVCTEIGTDTDCSGCDNACGEGTKCCDKVCTATGTDTNCSDCGDACAEGQSCCDDLCTEIGTDTNCSGCGDACTGGKCCEGVCKETQTDNENCGDCENVCDTPSEKCVAGVCVTCDPPCTGLDVCCDLTCCKVCCGPDLGPKICCAEGKLCNNGQCTGCDPECTEAGSSCCGNPNAPPPTEEEPNPPVGECCSPGDTCCAGGCCGSSTSFCCDNKTCCYGDQVCCDGVCCAPGRYCDNGVCADCNPVCYSDEKCCGGTCIRWQCGDCPNACPSAAYRCSNDKCCEDGGVGCDEVCCPAGVTCCRGICCPNSTYKCCDGFCEISNNCRDCSGENLCPPEGGTPEQLWQCCDDGVCSNAAQRAGWVDYVCYS